MNLRSTSTKDLINEAFDRDDRVSAENINIEEEDGNVVLRGSVANMFEKGAAEMIAKGVKGVKRVDNRIGVSRTSAAPSDARIKSNAQGVLAHAQDVENNHVSVSVSAGVVTLSGRVPIRSMKQRATDLVAALSGVKEVKNEMRIAG